MGFVEKRNSCKWFIYFFNFEARGIKRRFLLLYFLVGAIQRITQEPGAGGEGLAGLAFTRVLVHTFASHAVIHGCAAQMPQCAFRMAAEQAVADGQNPRVGRVLAADFRDGMRISAGLWP